VTDHQHAWQARIVTDDERAELWMDTHGALVVPIRYPWPELMGLPGLGPTLAYELATALLDDGQRYRLAHHLGHRFDVPLVDAYDGIERDGVPIVADGVTVSRCCDAARLVGDSPEDPELLAAFTREFTRLLRTDELVGISLGPAEAWAVLGHLQMALRHPGATGETSDLARAVGRDIQARICRPGSALAWVADLAWKGH
jgi:hypothetical protein